MSLWNRVGFFWDNMVDRMDSFKDDLRDLNEINKRGAQGVKEAFTELADLTTDAIVGPLFKNVEIEGKKQGYKRAASEYEKAFAQITKSYQLAREQAEMEQIDYNDQVEVLTKQLCALEKQKSLLKRQFGQKVAKVSSKYNLAVETVQNMAETGRVLASDVFFITSYIHGYKDRKLQKAEQEGYREARSLYEEKIEKIKGNLQELKRMANADIKKLLDLIDDLLEAIAEERMKIADLNVLL